MPRDDDRSATCGRTNERSWLTLRASGGDDAGRLRHSGQSAYVVLALLTLARIRPEGLAFHSLTFVSRDALFIRCESPPTGSSSTLCDGKLDVFSRMLIVGMEVFSNRVISPLRSYFSRSVVTRT